jgi:hypothetical protein
MSQLVIKDSIVELPINFLDQELDEICFIRCQFIGDDKFNTNKHCKNIVILESSSKLKKLHFDGGYKSSSVTFLTSNNFENTEIIFSGSLDLVKFDAAEWSHARYIPELRLSADKSIYGIIRVDYGAMIDKLYIDSIRILKSLKFTGSSNETTIMNAHAVDDITVIPEQKSNFRIMNVTTKQLAFTKSFSSISISGGNHISSLSFKLDDETDKILNIDLVNTTVDHELQFANSKDPKSTKCEISNIKFSNINIFTFHKCQMSCFSLVNCDLSKTYVIFKHCKIDDINTEGVIWPHEIHASHFNYKADELAELHQTQSVYRQLKSISHKNKDIDSFLLFRWHEYDSMTKLSLFRIKLLLTYVTAIGFDLLHIRNTIVLPEITHRRHSNIITMFIYELTSYLILVISSVLSAHNTSLFRPIFFLIFGTPVFLYILGYYCSLSQIIELSAHVINPAHRDEVTINGVVIAISPIHSLFFRVFSSVLIYKIILSFRRYSNI